MSYDPLCELLAQHFLDAEPVPVRREQVVALAKEIQRAIEDWIHDNIPPGP